MKVGGWIKMVGKTVGKCYCGGSIKQYKSSWGDGTAVKCNKCGSGDVFNDAKNIKKVIKALGTEDGW